MSTEKSNPHIYEFTVLESHLDTFGHINNATYLTLFEQARWDWITAGGYGLKEIQKNQIGPTILELKIQYKREIGLREKIRIETRVVDFNLKVGKVEQKMLNEKNEICTIIELTVGVFDMRARRLVTAPDAWVTAIGLK